MAGDDYSADVNTGGVLVVGGSAQGQLETGGDRDWFKVYLNAGASYYFTLAGSSSGSGALRDPYVYLYSSSGESITSNDDSGGKLDSRLVYTPSASGYYYVAAASNQDTGTGAYQLSAGSYDNDYSSSKPGSLKAGESLTGELQVQGDVDWVKVELTAGNLYSITLQGTDSGKGTLSDPYLYLYDSSNTVVSSDDDGSGRRDSVVTYTPTTSGTYYLGLAAYQNASTGTYTVSLNATAQVDDFSAGADTTGKLQAGGSVQGQLERNGDQDRFAVELEAGKTYYFNLEGSPTSGGTLSDSYLTLYDADGNKIAYNDDGGEGLNSRVVYTAATSGTYYLGAGGFADAQAGTYTLSAGALPASQQGASASSTDHITGYGVRQGSLSSDGGHEWVSVALEAATTYMIVLEGSGGDSSLQDATLDLRDQYGGQVAAAQTDSSSGQRTISFTTEESGAYYIDIGSTGENDSGNYLLSIVGRQVDQFNQAANLGNWSATNLFESLAGGSSSTLAGSSAQAGASAASDDGQTTSRLTSTSQGATTGTLAANS